MTRSTTATSHAIRRIVSTTALAVALATPLALAPVLTVPAHAFFGGFGRIVYDPTNHAENLLTAARSLEQINNQIASLQNEAQMLINQARNLASLPHSSLQQLQRNVTRTQQLLDEAQNIAFEVQEVDQAFEREYAAPDLSMSEQQLLDDARTRWSNTMGGLQDAMRVQAGVTSNIEAQRTEMATLVEQSQGATGALQASQAGNQLLALQSQQLSDLTALLAATGRAEALAEAERAAAAEQGRIQRERFLAPGTGYQPGNARMFND
ncbi:P-type conjugative transfer protein TrbJ [Paracoccus aminovorans]|uniref:P-type conjugative transfer protein TrbJ n=1 Tax=Paracoccus aminovorans TaxID=34004 RepID=UPI000783A868|nr:P-type conjugative transfer protein TrbJ [Paracoccus aminovorans]MDQ7777309.1 P-type conjugative transfer protein TrbJ [Paracoccus aminovorans]